MCERWNFFRLFQCFVSVTGMRGRVKQSRPPSTLFNCSFISDVRTSLKLKHWNSFGVLKNMLMILKQFQCFISVLFYHSRALRWRHDEESSSTCLVETQSIDRLPRRHKLQLQVRQVQDQQVLYDLVRNTLVDRYKLSVHPTTNGRLPCRDCSAVSWSSSLSSEHRLQQSITVVQAVARRCCKTHCKSPTSCIGVRGCTVCRSQQCHMPGRRVKVTRRQRELWRRKATISRDERIT